MNVDDLKKYAFGIGIISLAASVALGVGHPQFFFQSYLFAFLFLSSVVLGSLGILLLYLLVGGKWGRPVRPILASTVSTLPWLVLLFVPILIGVKHIYPWAMIEPGGEFLGAHKQWLFQMPFFIARSVFYLFAFNLLAAWALRMIHFELREGKPHARSKQAGAVGFLSFFILMSAAAFDWVMSLEPHWFSSIFGALINSGFALSTFSFTVIVLAWLCRRYPEKFSITSDAAHDLGNLLLATTMFWTYMNLSQYIIIWSGNLPEEITWYVARSNGGWRYLSTGLFLGQFAFTFAILLGMERKRALQRLVRVAYWVLAMRVLDTFWLTTPDFHPGQIIVRPTDVSLLIGLFALWSSFFFGRLKKEAAL